MRIRPLRIVAAVGLAAVVFAVIYAGFVVAYGTMMEPELGVMGAHRYALDNLAMFFSIAGASVMAIACWIVMRGCGGGHLGNSLVACIGVSAAEVGAETLVDVGSIGPLTFVAVAVKVCGALLGGLAAKESDAKTAMSRQLATLTNAP